MHSSITMGIMASMYKTESFLVQTEPTSKEQRVIKEETVFQPRKVKKVRPVLLAVKDSKVAKVSPVIKAKKVISFSFLN